MLGDAFAIWMTGFGLACVAWKNQHDEKWKKICTEQAQQGDVQKAIQTFHETLALNTPDNCKLMTRLLIRQKNWTELKETLKKITPEDREAYEAKAFLHLSQNDAASIRQAYHSYRQAGQRRDAAKALCKLAELEENQNFFRQALQEDQVAALSYKWEKKTDAIKTNLEEARQDYTESLNVPSTTTSDLYTKVEARPSCDLKALIETKLDQATNFDELLQLSLEPLKKYLGDKIIDNIKTHWKEQAVHYAAVALGKSHNTRGFNSHRLLPVRIAFLLQLIQKIRSQQCDVIAKITASGLTEEDAINLLTKEISISAESCFLSILVASCSEKHDNAPFVDYVFQRLQNLEERDEFVVRTGYFTDLVRPGKHAIYVSFKKLNGQVVISILNRGDGIELHNPMWRLMKKVAPVVLLPINFETKKDALRTYISGLVDAYGLHKNEAIKLIYNFALLPQGRPSQSVQSIQKAGNCLLAGWNAGAALRFNNKPFYRLSREMEKEFAGRLQESFAQKSKE